MSERKSNRKCQAGEEAVVTACLELYGIAPDLNVWAGYSEPGALYPELTEAAERAELKTLLSL